MNMTIEPAIPLNRIRDQVPPDQVIRGAPYGLLDECEQLPWENPTRTWTFRLSRRPSKAKLTAFMDRFELVFRIHEGRGDYRSAWWYSREVPQEVIFKGLFTDLNPSTGPHFHQRAADGPRIAIWFGRIHDFVTFDSSD